MNRDPSALVRTTLASSGLPSLLTINSGASVAKKFLPPNDEGALTDRELFVGVMSLLGFLLFLDSFIVYYIRILVFNF